MYNNIGRKIKILAIVIAIFSSIVSIAFGIICASEKAVKAAVFCFIFGPIISWVSSFFLYAIGQLVENSDKTVKIRSENQKLNRRMVVAIEKIAGVQYVEKIEKKEDEIDVEDEEVVVEKIEKENKKTAKKEKKEEKKIVEQSVKTKPVFKNVQINIEEFNKSKEYLKNVTEEDVKELRKEYKDWSKQIEKLTNEVLIEILENADNWQEQYVLLSCLEIYKRYENQIR